jgi:hypothetical protein
MSGMAIEESDNPDLQLSTESRVQISGMALNCSVFQPLLTVL